MVDLEISLVKAFNWSLYEIDETSVDSLLPFIFRLTAANGGAAPEKVYVDEIDWL